VWSRDTTKKDENRKPRKKEIEGQKPRKGFLLVSIHRDTQKTEKREDKNKKMERQAKMKQKARSKGKGLSTCIT
jgi:hypothetical protein